MGDTTVLPTWRQQLKENVGLHLAGLLISGTLAYLVSGFFASIISHHASYMANNAAYYSEVDGGMRWINLYGQIENLFIIIGISLGILGISVALRADSLRERRQQPLRRLFKYLIIGFIGALITAVAGAAVAEVIYPVPSTYSQLESQIVFKNNKLRMWFTAGGLAIFPIVSMAIDLKRSITKRRKSQQQRYDTIVQRYRDVLERIDREAEPREEILERYDISSKESIERREELLEPFNSQISRYEELLDKATKISSEYQEISGELDGIEDATNDARRAIKAGRQDIGEIHQRLARYQRKISLVKQKESLLERIQYSHQHDSIPQYVANRLMGIGIDEDLSESDLERSERLLDITRNTIDMEESRSEVRTELIWEKLFGGDKEDGSYRDDHESSLEHLLEITQLGLRILSFINHNEPEYTGISNQELIGEINSTIDDENINRLNGRVEQLENIEDRIWTVERVQSLEWVEFENVIGKLWQNLGYKTSITQQSADEGIDVVAVNDTERIAIQAKRYAANNKVGNRTVRNTAGVLPRNFDKVVVATTSLFTQPALDEARKYGNQVELIDGVQLVEMLNKSDLVPPEK